METNLSIEQLAELKIAIKKADTELQDKLGKNKELEKRNSHLTQENKRLSDEIEVQDQRKDNAIKDNESLRAEKEGILSKFAEENEKQYKELREREGAVATKEQNNALRLIEIEKREGRLVNKEKSNKAILEEAKAVEKEAKEETLRNEEKILTIQAERKKIREREDQVAEKKRALEEVKSDLEKVKIEIEEKEIAVLEEGQHNANLVAELRNKEVNIKNDLERLERLNAVYKEMKDFVAENSNISIEDVEKMILWGENVVVEQESTPEEVEEAKEIEAPVQEEVKEDELWATVEKDPAVLSEMKMPELREEVKNRGLDLPQNAKKEDLIDLLSK